MNYSKILILILSTLLMHSQTKTVAELFGDIRGPLNATTVTSVGGQTASNIAQATKATNSGTLQLNGGVIGPISQNFVNVVGGVTANQVTQGVLLALAATSNPTPAAIVQRNDSGNFSANQITLLQAPTLLTDAANKQYVDTVAALGLSPKEPAQVVATNNITTLSGLPTVDGVTLISGDIILLIAQIDAVNNGLWVVASGAWTRPSDFENGTEAGAAYVLILEGNSYAGSSWVCSSANATIGTDDLTFVEFSLPSQTTGNNVGSGSGDIYAGNDGIVMNFRTIAGDSYLTVDTDTSSANTVSITSNATSANTASAIVARDTSGDFSAGTITANLIGAVTGTASENVPTGGGIMTGTLVLPNGSATAPGLKFIGNSTTNTGIYSSNLNDISITTADTQALRVSNIGIVSINSLTPTAGVVHNDSSGNLSSSLIVNADVSDTAAITDNKLATIATAGKISNSATTATSANTASAIVARDGSGNFSAGTITATLSGAAQLPDGSAASPSLSFSSSPTTGISSPTSNTLSFDTNGAERMNINATGTVSINSFATAGVVHNNASGNLSSSLIVNADISDTAAIVDTKLATIATAGKVSNSATTATSANTASAIVARDGSGDFSAGTITATLSGAAQLPNGSAASPSLNFSSSPTTGISSPTSNTLSFDTDGNERMNINATGTVSINSFATAGVVHNNASGNLSSSLIVNADISDTAAIVDTKLATIATAGKVSNSATTATNSNTASAIVARDGSGDFSAGIITASLSGTASGNVPTGGGTMTGALVLPNGTTSTPGLKFTGNGAANAGLSSSNSNNLAFSVSGGPAMSISNIGIVSINSLTPTAGVVHNDSSGNLSSSLIVNADISSSAAISDNKLATITTAGKVSNTATTATSANTTSAIVARDSSGNFSAATITATLNGTVNGSALDNVLKSGDTMTGPLALPAGSAGEPALNYSSDGSTNGTGMYFPASHSLSLSTNGSEALNINSSGTILIDSLAGTAGVVHNDSSGNLSSSLIVNADISNSAAISDNKLATITTAGKVSNSATTATSANTTSAIVARDGSGNFSAGTITASLTGAASLNVPKAGGTMTGALTLPAGSTSSPMLNFASSTTTGLSASPNDNLNFIASGANKMIINSQQIKTEAILALGSVVCNQATQTSTATESASVIVNSTTSILFLNSSDPISAFTVIFPAAPTDGQLFTIVLTSNFSINLISSIPDEGFIFNPINTLDPATWTSSTGGASVTYIYSGSQTTWYRLNRG